MMPLQTILCPTDFSEASRRAFDLACSLAARHGGKVIVAHVNEALYGAHSYGGMLVQVRPDDYPARLMEALHEYQSPYPEVTVKHVLMEGQPADEILRLATEMKCDLVVMSTHGRTGWYHLIMGSVAEQVLRQAPCPVVTWRPMAKAIPTEQAGHAVEAAPAK